MKRKAKDLISDYFLNGWGISPDKEFEIQYVDAKQFLQPERMDLICKLVYIDCKVKQRNLDFAKELYTEHIRAFSLGTFKEPGNNEKNSIEKYFAFFDYLIENCQKEKLSADKSVVCVGDDGNILDGSHRTAVAIYFNIPLPVIYIPNIKVDYGTKHFKSLGLKEEYLDYITYQYIRYIDNVYIACLWPIADDNEKKKIAERFIQEKASVYYKKDIKLNYNGLKQLMIHTYGEQKWSGDIENAFCGISAKLDCCYKENSYTTVFVLSGASLDSIVDLKSKIRNLYDIQNHSIHITDTKDEAIYLGQVIFNKNSIDLLNYGNPFNFPMFMKKLNIYKDALINNKYNPEDFIVDSGSVLALYGVRDTTDIDYMTLIEEKLPRSDIYENHMGYKNHTFYNYSLDNLIYNPKRYLYYFGIKFVSFEDTIAMKKKRGEKKDIRDIKLMKCIEIHRKGKLTFNEKICRLKEIIKKKSQKNKLLLLGLCCYRFFKNIRKKTIRKIRKLMKRKY